MWCTPSLYCLTTTLVVDGVGGDDFEVECLRSAGRCREAQGNCRPPAAETHLMIAREKKKCASH